MTIRVWLLALAVVAMALAGCAPKMFVHPNPGAVNQVADASQCEYEILMAQRGVRIPYWYNNRQALGYALGAAIGQAIRDDQLRTLCMQAKGYAAVPLDGAPAPLGQAQPYLPGIDAPVAYVPVANQGAAARGDAVAVAVPTVGAAPSVAASLKGESKYMFTAEGIAKATGCTPPSIAMTAKGAGSESFMVGCPNGTTLAIRCEVDGCRILQ